MLRFIYKAKAGPAEIRQGVIEADDRQLAVKKIIGFGLTPLEIREEKVSKPVFEKKKLPVQPWFSRISLKDLTVFSTQLYDLVDADIPLLRVIELITQQTPRPWFKDVLKEIKKSVQDGRSLSQSLDLCRGIFPSYFIFLIKAGELSGRLKPVLKRLSQLTEKQDEVMARVRMSLTYPLFILLVGCLTIFVLVTFVVPRMAVMLEDLDQSLPLMTGILIAFGEFMARTWWLMVLAGLALFWGVRKKRQTPEGQLFFDRLFLKLPFFGRLFKIQELERMARVMGLMLENGVDLPKSLDCALGVMDNALLQLAMKKISRGVTQGQRLTDVLGSSPVFEQAVIDLIAVSEESGHLENGFLKWAEIYERESERTMKTATALLEPVMILILGGIVGLIVMAMLLPIFRMNLMMDG